MELLLAAGIPSAITAFCFWIIEKKFRRGQLRSNRRGQGGKKSLTRKKRTVNSFSTRCLRL